MLSGRQRRARVAINLLPENPSSPSGAHWFWTRMIPEMASRLDPGEELHLLVSPKSRHLYQGYGPDVHYITYPWSNERRTARTLTEHLYSPVRLPLSRINVFNTLMAPAREYPLVARHPHEDDARFHRTRLAEPAGPCLPPDERPALRAGRGRHHHQL